MSQQGVRLEFKLHPALHKFSCKVEPVGVEPTILIVSDVRLYYKSKPIWPLVVYQYSTHIQLCQLSSLGQESTWYAVATNTDPQFQEGPGLVAVPRSTTGTSLEASREMRASTVFGIMSIVPPSFKGFGLLVHLVAVLPSP